MLELPLDLSGTSVEVNFFLLRNGVAGTLFTEGVLPYQCVCCNLLHCFSVSMQSNTESPISILT